MKTYAIFTNENGSCVSLLEIKNLTESDLRTLKEQVRENSELQKTKELELKCAIDNLDKTVQELKHEIAILKGEE